jgi:hypothetical protein
MYKFDFKIEWGTKLETAVAGITLGAICAKLFGLISIDWDLIFLPILIYILIKHPPLEIKRKDDDEQDL